MNHERVVLFVDFANIDRAARDVQVEMDYAHLLDYMAEGRFLVEAHVYIPIDPRNEHSLDRLVESLWRSGYVVRQKIGATAGTSYKCNFDVEITMDVLSTAYQVKPDIIVLATGDGDFSPLVQEVRRLGIRLEVASFEASASRELKLKSSGFISLDVYVREALESELGPQGTTGNAGPEPPLEGQMELHPAHDGEEPNNYGTDSAAPLRGDSVNLPNANDY